MKTIETKNSNPSTDEMRWQAIVTRDKKSEGHFIYAVKTTGIYCSPACPSRQPKRENVQFFNDAAEAEAAGFRPCKRCRQGLTSLADRHAAQIASVCRFIEQAEETPTLNELAKYAGMSTFHFHHLFKSITGLTPKGYADAHRSQRVREHLSQDTSVTDAIFDAGYHSNGRFYEKSNAMLGMTPTAFRAGGQGMKIYFAVGLCSLGDILVAQSERGICAILLGDDPQKLLRDLQDKFPKADLVGGDNAFEQRMAQVIGFIEAPDTGLDLPLDIRGTAFQQRVWQALCDIPVGSTVSYAVIAQKIGAPKAVRAVAGACAANMLAVAIPCHRVVRNDGALSGYRWGVERKRALLDKEAKA